MSTQNIELKNQLLSLKRATIPGATVDGSEIRIIISHVKKEGDARAKAQACVARRSGVSLDTFTGYLDRVFFNKAGDFCFTMLAKERVDVEKRAFCYRTFNVSSGQVTSLELLATAKKKRA